jgi:hypothetical protein
MNKTSAILQSLGFGYGLDGILIPQQRQAFFVACKLKMTLPAIYIFLHVLTVVIFFCKLNFVDKYKKPLIKAHVILFLILLIDIFIVNLRGVWLDRLLVVAFLLTASMTFALYRRTLKTWQKIYFGFYLVYPIFAASTFLMDRIFFVLVASPLLVTLTVPETKFTTKDYEVREIVGALAPVQFALMKKGLVTERYLGITNDPEITHKEITGLSIISVTNDTTFANLTSGDKTYKIAFHR